MEVLHPCFVGEKAEKLNISCKNVIVQCFSFRLHHIVKDGVEENWSFVLHIWSLLTPCLPHTSNANNRSPSFSSITLHSPPNEGWSYSAAELHCHTGLSLYQLFFTPLYQFSTNQSDTPLRKTVWLFLVDKCIYSYTDPHRQLICYMS